MGDLVERLRSADMNSQQRVLGSRIFGEAADEITRLRAALTARDERMKAEGARDAQAELIEEPTEPGSFVGDIWFGRQDNRTYGTHRWDGAAWQALPTETEALIGLLAKERAKIARLTEALDEKQDGGKSFWMKWTQKRLELNRAMFLRDAKLALAGDVRALRNRVELMEAGPVSIVLSAALQENADE